MLSPLMPGRGVRTHIVSDLHRHPIQKSKLPHRQCVLTPANIYRVLIPGTIRMAQYNNLE